MHDYFKLIPRRPIDLHLGHLSRARSEIYLLPSAAVAPLPVAKGYKLFLSLCSKLGSEYKSGLMQTDGGAKRMTEALFSY